MPDQDIPQIPLGLASAMADLLTHNAAFKAGLSDAYLKAVRDHIWRVNTMSVRQGIQTAPPTLTLWARILADFEG